MKQLFLKYLASLVLSTVVCVAQNQPKIDSLTRELKGTLADTARVFKLISLSMHYQGFDYDKAFQFGEEALTLSQKINYSRGTGESHNNLGDLYWYKNDLAAAAGHYMQALHIFERTGNSQALAGSFRNLGWIYQEKDNLKLAMSYHRRSLAINAALGRKKEMSHNYNDIGIVHIRGQAYDSAVFYLEKSMKLQTDMVNKEGMVSSYGNLAVAYDKLGNRKKAEENMFMAVKLAEEIGVKQHIAATYCNLGSFYAKTNQLDKSIEMLEKSLMVAREINYFIGLKDIYQNLALVHAKRKEFLKASQYQDMLIKVKDTIYNVNNSRHVNEMTAKYESEKKEIMISSLEKDKKLSDEKLERERYFKIYLGIFCLMIAGFALMLFRGNVHKKKANEALSSAYKEIEIKNKDITDSITYSKRIQEATLPSRELKYKLFPDAFVLFRPKDIVSGDFYWYAEKNGKKLIAACDCTGHGVPGALMSMIGNNILHQIVNEKGITSAAAILDHLHLEIRKSLKQQEHAESQDGMDIALVVFDTDREIEFAGAQRPLWIIRRDSREVEEIKGNKFSIGGWQMEENRKFSGHRISLNKDDCIYFFSDGFVDQFGGTDGKKFRTQHFRKLLLSICDKTMEQQEKILESTFIEYAGNHEQIDDVLVIGIKAG